MKEKIVEVYVIQRAKYQLLVAACDYYMRFIHSMF